MIMTLSLNLSTSALIDWFQLYLINPLQQSYFQKALLGGGLLALSSGLIGSLIILKRMTFLGDALSHTMISGVAMGYLVMKLVFNIEAHVISMLAGAIFATLITHFLIEWISKISSLKKDVSIGIIYTAIFSLGVTLISVFQDYIHIDITHFLVGDILGISQEELWSILFITSLTLIAILFFFRYFQIFSFDPVMAKVLRLPCSLLNYVLIVLLSLVIINSIFIVGMIMSIGLLITPAATALLVSQRLSSMMVYACLFGVTGVLGGLYSSFWLNTNSGSTVILFCALQFFITFTFSSKQGFLMKYRERIKRKSIHLQESILRQMIKSGNKQIDVNKIVGSSHRSRKKITRKQALQVLQILKKEKWIEKFKPSNFNPNSDSSLPSTYSKHTYQLTLQGEKKALQIHRAHRLWETYFYKRGEKMHQLHEKAEQKQTHHDPNLIAHLDHLLAFPTSDPHGSLIPEDFHSTALKDGVALSVLRQARPIQILSLSSKKDLPAHLKKGALYELQIDTKDSLKPWILVNKEDGIRYPLSYSQAKRVFVVEQK